MQVEIYGDQACTERPSGAVTEVYAKVSLGDCTETPISLGDVSNNSGVWIYNEEGYRQIEWYNQFASENSETPIVDGVYKLRYGFSGSIDVTGREFSFFKQF